MNIQNNSGTATHPASDPVTAIVTGFNLKTPGSKRAAAYNRDFLSDKSSIGLPFTMQTKEALYPIVATHAEGAYLQDVDNNRYVDILMGLGTNLFGHNPPFIRTAIEAQLTKGFALGPQSDLAGETAELFCRITGKDRVTFSNTGTEAVQTAMRIARAATGRDKIVLFTGSYHGHSDPALHKATKLEYIRRGALLRSHPAWLVALKPLLKRMVLTKAVPGFSGVAPSSACDIVLLEYGNPRSIDYIRRHGDSLAGVLVEPVQSRNPELQPREFLHEMRSVTEKTGSALIFDEMITGFRVAPGGAQSHFGIDADIATYGKIAGGGLPLSLIAGKGRFMDFVDGGAWAYGDSSFPKVAPTFFAGTYCRHPLALATAKAVATRLLEDGPALQEGLNVRTQAFVERLNGALKDAGLPVAFMSFGSFFSISATRSRISPQAATMLSFLLLTSGVHLRAGDRGGFLSTAHSDDDIAFVHDAVLQSLTALADHRLLNRH
ncbi:aspartate aminotransferase family protein [Agrobacterium tumefaciens]|uniref:aspartate aminotransferase family protein n=1 Tax=Agrobacterium tumefaciens TaxID=358 RepID=UPI0015721706|nr:aspartate aminotransferase family protein [Agrobacterium tumefaciens]WCJ65353.1 aspartate aminotransferase family protein [Agrobacterium tumefaciens]